MLLTPEQLVQQIHDSPTRIVLAAAGGGSRAIADLLEVPGGSRTLLEAVVPYSAPAMTAWLGSRPDESCSAATARAMAMVAFLRRRYGGSGARLATGDGGVAMIGRSATGVASTWPAWLARPAWPPTGRNAARTAFTSPCKPPR